MKYTDEQREEVFAFFEEGCTAREIFEVTGIPIGTINRWRSERRSSKISADEDLRRECEDLRRECEDLRRECEDLRRRVEPLESYINRLEKSKKKESDWEEPVKGWKPPQR